MRGMDERTVTVEKDRLIRTLSVNKEGHRAIFEEALEAYRKKVTDELERRLDDVKAGRKIDVFFRLPQPEDHTEDYEAAIQRAEWEVGDEIELSHEEFNAYVLNRWVWDQSFHANTASYLAP